MRRFRFKSINVRSRDRASDKTANRRVSPGNDPRRSMRSAGNNQAKHTRGQHVLSGSSGMGYVREGK